MTFLASVPLWVWPLALGLGWVSVQSLRDRRTPLVVLYTMPLLGLLTLRMVAGFGAGPLVWSALAIGYALGAWVGWKRQSVRTRTKTPRYVEQRGEVLTALTVFTLFALNFAVGALAAISPELLTAYPLPLVLSLVAGLASGTFGGRALFVASSPVGYQRAPV